jgi:biotin carboxyl carrier protein
MTEYHFEIDGSSYRVKIKETRPDHATVEVNGTEYRVEIERAAAAPVRTASTPSLPPIAPRIASAGPRVAMADGIVRAPLPGVILKVVRKPGEAVEVDEPVLVLEAMKMENEIRAPIAGTIAELFVVEGGSVNTGDALFRINP